MNIEFAAIRNATSVTAFYKKKLDEYQQAVIEVSVSLIVAKKAISSKTLEGSMWLLTVFSRNKLIKALLNSSCDLSCTNFTFYNHVKPSDKLCRVKGLLTQQSSAKQSYLLFPAKNRCTGNIIRVPRRVYAQCGESGLWLGYRKRLFVHRYHIDDHW